MSLMKPWLAFSYFNATRNLIFVGSNRTVLNVKMSNSLEKGLQMPKQADVSGHTENDKWQTNRCKFRFKNVIWSSVTTHPNCSQLLGLYNDATLASVYHLIYLIQGDRTKVLFRFWSNKSWELLTLNFYHSCFLNH